MSGIKVSTEVQNVGNMPTIGAGATLPATGNKYGLFLNTTDNTVYYWNGSTWVATGAAGSVPQLKTVLAVGNNGADGQVINLYVNSTHNASYQGAQIAFYNGSGNTGVIRADTIVGNNTYALPSLSGTFLVNENFRKGQITLNNGLFTLVDPLVNVNSVCIPVRRSGYLSSNIGIIAAACTPLGTVSFTSQKTNLTTETGDNSIVDYIIYY